MEPWSSDQMLAAVAVITAIANAVATVVHAFRVPYRESDKAESVHALESNLKLRATYPPDPPPTHGLVDR